MITKEKIKELVEEKIAGTELFLVNIIVSSANRIKVELDADNGLTVDHCVEVSRYVERSFDREEEDFELVVTSPGLDQPLKLKRQFLKNIGRNVKVKLKEGKELKGELMEASDDAITVNIKEKKALDGKKKKWVHTPIKLNLSSIEETKIIISFK